MKLDEAMEAIQATGEHIDLLVNNAGLVILKETIDVTEEDIDRYVVWVRVVQRRTIKTRNTGNSEL